MTPENFCYWLQGRVELGVEGPPSTEEWKMIVKHLQLTFTKVTEPFPATPEITYTTGTPIVLPYEVTCQNTASYQ